MVLFWTDLNLLTAPALKFNIAATQQNTNLSSLELSSSLVWSEKRRWSTVRGLGSRQIQYYECMAATVYETEISGRDWRILHPRPQSYS